MTMNGPNQGAQNNNHRNLPEQTVDHSTSADPPTRKAVVKPSQEQIVNLHEEDPSRVYAHGEKQVPGLEVGITETHSRQEKSKRFRP